MIMKIASIFFALLFLAFAVVQYNDPDPLLWILIYSYVALIAALYLFKVYPVRLLLVSIIGLLIFGCFYIPGIIEWLTVGRPGELTQEMKATKPYIEESREFLGLLIAVGVLVLYYFRERRMV